MVSSAATAATCTSPMTRIGSVRSTTEHDSLVVQRDSGLPAKPAGKDDTERTNEFMNVFRGLFPPLITPLDEQGRVDEKGLRDHVDFVIASGVDGMCAGSSTG